MPNLTPATQAARIDQALQVWGLLEANPRMTQAEACAHIDMDVQAYRRWIAEAEPMLEEFRNAIMGIRRLELMRIMAAREAVLTQVISDGLNVITDPAARLEIHKYLVAHGNDLLEAVHAGQDDGAEFLTGPQLIEAESKFASHEIELNLKIKQPDVIDSQFSDAS